MHHLQLLKEGIEKLENGHVRSVEDAAMAACDLYAGLASEINVCREYQVRVKKILTDIITETGQIEWQGEIAKCYIPKSSVSIRYDAKAIDVLCVGNPDLAAQLAPFRIESERAGSLTIR